MSAPSAPEPQTPAGALPPTPIRSGRWNQLQIIAYANYAFGLLATVIWLGLFPEIADQPPGDDGLGRWPLSQIGPIVIGGLGSTVQIGVTSAKLIMLSRSRLDRDVKQPLGRPWLIPWWIKLCYAGVFVIVSAIGAAASGGGMHAWVTMIMNEVFLGWILAGPLFWLGALLIVIVVKLASSGPRMIIGAARSDGPDHERLESGGRGATLLGAAVLLVGGIGGAVTYTSPRWRDIRPLLGFVNDEVEVRLPALLHLAQVLTWLSILLIAGGLIMQLVGWILRAKTWQGQRSH